MDLIANVSEFMYGFLEAIIFLVFVLNLTGKRDFYKKDPKWCIVYIVLYTMLCYWVTVYIPFGFHAIILMVLNVMLASLIFQVSIYSTVIAEAIVYVYFIFSEVVVPVLLTAALHVSVSDIITIPKYRLIAGWITKVLQMIGLWLLFRKENRFLKHTALVKKENWIVTFPFFQVILLALFMISYTYTVDKRTNMVIYTGLFYAIMLVLFLMSIIEYREREKSLKVKSKLEAQQQYVGNMETVLDLLRREKHDFANHLNTIAGLCSVNRSDSLDKIKEYLQKITHNYEPTYTFYASGSDYVDGLLTVKSNIAHQNHITMDVDFDVPLSEAEIDDGNLISIVSNIIDNAFDAMNSEETEKAKILSVLSYADSEGVYLSISNNGPQIPEKNLPKIFDNRFSTKPNKQERGYGLYIVNQLVRQSGGEITVTSSNGHTEFLIKLRKRTPAQKLA